LCHKYKRVGARPTPTRQSIFGGIIMFEVDPETYRYFFSASAQVFAAIFAVVAIAYNYRIMVISRKLEDLSKEKVRKAILHQDHWGFDELKMKLNGILSVEINKKIKEAIWHLDESMIELILDSIQSRCGSLISDVRKGIQSDEDEQSKKNKNQRIQNFESIKNSIAGTKSEFIEVSARKSEALKRVIQSVIIAAAMVCISLVMFLIEEYLCK